MSSVRFHNQSQFRFRRPIIIEDKAIEKNGSEEMRLDYGKLTAIVAPALLFFGMLRLVLYYLHFNVNILKFIDLSEILTSFFDIIILVLMASATLIISIYLNFDYVERKYINQNRKIYKKRSTELRSYLNPQNWTPRGIIYVITALASYALLIVVMFLFLGDDGYVKYLIGYISALVVPPLYFSRVESTKSLKNIEQVVVFWAYYLLVTSAFIYFITSFDVDRVKHHAKFHDVRVLYKNNEVFASGSACTYIGHTRGYLFLYNSQTNTTLVEKMEEVKTIEFPQIKAPKIQ